MKPIYVAVNEETGALGGGAGGRSIRAYTTPGRANAQKTMFDEIVTYVPQLEGHVMVSKEHYDYLLDRLAFLDALESAGVDNWSGYGYAYEIYNEGEEE